MSLPVVIGIDPSSKKLAAVAAFGTPDRPRLVDWTARRLTTGNWDTSVTALAMEWAWDIIGVARSAGDPVVYLEEPVVGRGGVRSTVVQAFTSGALQGALAYECVPVHLVNVGTWKREVVGNGHASKTDVGRLVRDDWPAAAAAVGSDQDLLDAAAICLYGLKVQARAGRIVEGGVGLP